MEELVKWLKENLGSNITIVTPQFERTEPLAFDWKPATEDDFYNVINKAPWDILRGLGFRKWDTMNNIIKENQQRKDRNIHKIPCINDPSHNLIIDISKKKGVPSELLDIDEDIILFPGEWYSIIPDGFITTDIEGEEIIFQRGKTDDDIRFGCLPYGIRRACINNEQEKG